MHTIIKANSMEGYNGIQHCLIPFLSILSPNPTAQNSASLGVLQSLNNSCILCLDEPTFSISH